VAFERHIHFQAFDVMLHGRAEALLCGCRHDVADDVMLDTTGTIPGNLFEVQENNGRVLRSERSKQRCRRNVQAGSKNGIYRTSVITTFIALNAVVRSWRTRRHPHSMACSMALRHPRLAEIYEAVRFYLILSLSLLIATAGLTAWFLRNALFPLHQLASEACGISASQWSFKPPETARSTRELAPLTRAIEAALARLELSFA
jgi:hypothetical protein